MSKMEIYEHYFYELGKCKHYELKYKKYEDIDSGKFDKYYNKHLFHKNEAAKYYSKMKESPVYMDGLNDDSIWVDSRYFHETLLPTEEA